MNVQSLLVPFSGRDNGLLLYHNQRSPIHLHNQRSPIQSPQPAL
ncbi:hypothetical protein VB775_24905 [Pseudanabaena sp. CCNP1317]|nr:hypothetical protein [Pseudanabaena sp. CCNP1317]